MITSGGIVSPNGMPPAIVHKLNSTANEIHSDPGVRKQFETMGSETTVKSPEQFGAIIKADLEKWSEVIRKGRISVD